MCEWAPVLWALSEIELGFHVLVAITYQQSMTPCLSTSHANHSKHDEHPAVHLLQCMKPRWAHFPHWLAWNEGDFWESFSAEVQITSADGDAKCLENPSVWSVVLSLRYYADQLKTGRLSRKARVPSNVIWETRDVPGVTNRPPPYGLLQNGGGMIRHRIQSTSSSRSKLQGFFSPDGEPADHSTAVTDPKV